MTDGEALYRAILADPADDTARLVYADWLEENGDALRAEFVRAQLAPLPAADGYHRSSADCRCRTCQTVRRDARYADWFAPWLAFHPFPAYRVRRAGDRFVVAWEAPAAGGGADLIHPEFSRGFVAHVACTAAAFVAHAKALFACHPIERVTLGDRYPAAVATDFTPASARAPLGTMRVGDYFFREGRGHDRQWSRHHLPGKILRHWPVPPAGRPRRFPAGERDGHLSAACVRLGRTLAGLPT